MTITIGKMSGKLKKYKYHVSDVPCLNLYAEFRVSIQNFLWKNQNQNQNQNQN
jgi:hypothetical protein